MSEAILNLERRYRVEGQPALLPYSLAKKATRYPAICVAEWHIEQPPADRNSNLCSACTEELRRSWQIIAANYSTLTDGIVPSQSFAASETRGSGSIYPPLPIDADISDLLRELRESIWSVVHGIIEDRPDWPVPRNPTVDVLADNLAKWHVPYIATHPRPGHSGTVLTETVELAHRVREVSSGLPAVEAPTEIACTKYLPKEKDDNGRPRPPIKCPGQIALVQTPGYPDQARCTNDPTHTIPLPLWSQATRQSATKRGKITGHLLSKFGTHKASKQP